MTLDSHRKIPLMMCYECGYIEGRTIEAKKKGETNYQHLKKLNFNEMVAFLADKLNMPEERFAAWLNEEA
jgi:hypothetical protein